MNEYFFKMKKISFFEMINKFDKYILLLSIIFILIFITIKNKKLIFQMNLSTNLAKEKKKINILKMN